MSTSHTLGKVASDRRSPCTLCKQKFVVNNKLKLSCLEAPVARRCASLVALVGLRSAQRIIYEVSAQRKKNSVSRDQRSKHVKVEAWPSFEHICGLEWSQSNICPKCACVLTNTTGREAKDVVIDQFRFSWLQYTDSAFLANLDGWKVGAERPHIWTFHKQWQALLCLLHDATAMLCLKINSTTGEVELKIIPVGCSSSEYAACMSYNLMGDLMNHALHSADGTSNGDVVVTVPDLLKAAIDRLHPPGEICRPACIYTNPGNVNGATTLQSVEPASSAVPSITAEADSSIHETKLGWLQQSGPLVLASFDGWKAGGGKRSHVWTFHRKWQSLTCLLEDPAVILRLTIDPHQHFWQLNAVPYRYDGTVSDACKSYNLMEEVMNRAGKDNVPVETVPQLLDFVVNRLKVCCGICKPERFFPTPSLDGKTRLTTGSVEVLQHIHCGVVGFRGRRCAVCCRSYEASRAARQRVARLSRERKVLG